MMYISSGNLFAKIILIFMGILLTIILYFWYKYSYWWRRNVPYLKPTIPFGNFKQLLTGNTHMSVLCNELYHKIKSQGHKFGGVFFINSPVLVLTDPALIKSVLVLNFEHFIDRGIYMHVDKDPLLKHLFALSPAPWRKLRTKLSPTFSSGKIKNMFDIVLMLGKNIVHATEANTENPIEINDLSIRFTIDAVGQCAFGIDCNSLKNPHEHFRKIADPVRRPPLFIGLKVFMSLLSPSILKLINTNIMDEQITKFFLDVVQKNINFREETNFYRNDFFQLLLEEKWNDEQLDDNVDFKMTPKVMAAQAFVFFAAGFETSSMTITFCLFELSRNLELQEKVRTEIRKVMQKHGEELTYDGLKEMIYLDRCVQETLRMYPPLGYLNRICGKDYRIPDTDITLEKGTRILISLRGLQSDPEYFVDPDTFDPDRFLENNISNTTQFTNMPFGKGPRSCIGRWFGLIQVKVCLASMLTNFKFTLNPKTKLPLKYVPQSFAICLKDGIWLDAKKV